MKLNNPFLVAERTGSFFLGISCVFIACILMFLFISTAYTLGGNLLGLAAGATPILGRVLYAVFKGK